MKTHGLPRQSTSTASISRNFDALLVMTHEPGMSAYNYVERRMAPLNKELAAMSGSLILITVSSRSIQY